MRVNQMITKEKMLWFIIKFSQLILQGNVWGSVWRICMWILGLKGLMISLNDDDQYRPCPPGAVISLALQSVYCQSHGGCHGQNKGFQHKYLIIEGHCNRETSKTKLLTKLQNHVANFQYCRATRIQIERTNKTSSVIYKTCKLHLG